MADANLSGRVVDRIARIGVRNHFLRVPSRGGSLTGVQVGVEPPPVAVSAETEVIGCQLVRQGESLGVGQVGQVPQADARDLPQATRRSSS